MHEKILTLAAGISGAGEHEMELLQALCVAAETLWAERLRFGVSDEDCGEAFACAVAFTAAADLAAARSGGGVQSFTAGEISVKTSAGGAADKAAAALRQTAQRLMAPYAGETGLAFRGVRG